MIAFPFDQVLPKDECDRLFSAEEISKGGLPVFKLRKELPFGFKRDLSCVGNQVSVLIEQINRRVIKRTGSVNPQIKKCILKGKVIYEVIQYLDEEYTFKNSRFLIGRAPFLYYEHCLFVLLSKKI
jgi:hypothetical protein